MGDGGEGEEEIYQTPVIDALPTSVVPAPSSSGHGGEGMLKKSETVGSFLDEHSKGEVVCVQCLSVTLTLISLNSEYVLCTIGLSKTRECLFNGLALSGYLIRIGV